MDRKHGLDAPNNDSLKNIEQIGDRSGLSAVYPRAKDEWRDTDVLSGEDRTKKKEKEQETINLTIRKWFPVVGFLIPLPVVLLAISLALAAQFLDIKMAAFVLLPVFFAVFILGYVSYKSYQWVHEIFYAHSIKMMPYLLVHIILLGLAFRGLFLYSQVFHSGWTAVDIAITGGLTLLASIILSGILLFIWPSPKISSRWKFAIIAGMAFAIAGAHTLQMLLLG